MLAERAAQVVGVVSATAAIAATGVRRAPAWSRASPAGSRWTASPATLVTPTPSPGAVVEAQGINGKLNFNTVSGDLTPPTAGSSA